MTEPSPRIIILILTYHGREDVRACLHSLAEDGWAGSPRRIVVADNASTDDTLEAVRRDHPEAERIGFDENYGFAGGNQRAWEHLAEEYPHVEYLILLNQDTVVQPGWLEPLVSAFDRDVFLAAVQAKLRLHPETERINSAGNRSHYLGFGYSTGAREVDRGQYDQPREIDFPSGAAMGVRADLLKSYGLFDPAFFAYLEDAELGWRLRQMGWRVAVEPRSVVWHKHRFGTTLARYEHLERNRWRLLLIYYRARTLALLTPMLVTMELGQVGYALGKGLMPAKLRAWGWFVRPGHLREVLVERRQARRRRRVSDQQFMGGFAGRIDFPHINQGLVRWVMNPLFDLSWRCVRRLIRW